MNIMIDARWIFPEVSGIGQHTRLLIRGLQELGTGHEMELLFESEERAEEVKAGLASDWPHSVVPYGLFSLQNQLSLARWLRAKKVEVYHSTNYMMPLAGFRRHRRGPVRAVVTIHDLIPMVYRDHAPKSKKSRLYPVFARLMKEVAARSDRIITVSHSSREDVCELLGLPEKFQEKVKVVYNGLDPAFFEPHEVPRHEPPEILYVGRLDPYKNVPQLVGAFAEALRDLPAGTRLRIIGPPDERYPEALALARQQDLLPRMDWEGHVDDATLVNAYRRASVVVLPSEYEGFGLPVAEAMACGTPVICSDSSSLPEVAGEAAKTVPAGNLFALKNALIKVLNNPKLQEDMVQKGHQQAAQFTMRRMAEETLKVYEEVRR
jgi:alpha-1,3-rhamnosyl/mannosyltransferase